MLFLIALVALLALAHAFSPMRSTRPQLSKSDGRYSSSTQLHMAGFSRKPVSSKPEDNKSEYTIELERRLKIEEGKPCACLSGKLYKDCCQKMHNHIAGSGSGMEHKAEDVLRARYTAYKLGLPDYIIDSSHESSEDYIKFFKENQATLKNGRKKWEKDIVQNYMQNKLEYMYFKVLSEEVVSSDVRKIKFNAIFREEESSNILAVQEESEFILTFGKGWLYKDGDIEDMEQQAAEQALRAAGINFEVGKAADMGGGAAKSTDKQKQTFGGADTPVRTSQGQLGTFDKRKINYIPKGKG